LEQFALKSASPSAANEIFEVASNNTRSNPVKALLMKIL
jgi:hypothetical protein